MTEVTASDCLHNRRNSPAVSQAYEIISMHSMEQVCVHPPLR